MLTRKPQSEKPKNPEAKRPVQTAQVESSAPLLTPDTVTPANVLQLQRLHGNSAVRRMLSAQNAIAQRDPLPATDSADAGAIAGAPPVTTPSTDTSASADTTPAAGTDSAAPADPAAAATAADAKKEADFATRGAGLVTKLGPEAAPAATGSGGHSAGAPIEGYPDWFNTIQHRLNFGTTWGDTEEAAQTLLHDYAVWRATKDNGGRIPPSLEIFFRYIGRSNANLAANKKYADDPAQTYDGDIPTAGQLGAGQGYNWCASATSSVFIKALADKGLKPIGSRTLTQGWFNSNKLMVSGAAAATAELKPGDQISLVSSATPPSGHVATVVSVSGDNIMMVSGNSTNVKGGGTALEKTRRQPPPGDYSWGKAVPFDAVASDAAKTADLRKSSGYNGPLKPPGGADYIWIVSIVRLSSEQPADIDPNNAEQLKKLGLERIPTK